MFLLFFISCLQEFPDSPNKQFLDKTDDDFDGDGYSDGGEVVGGTDPTDENSKGAIPAPFIYLDFESEAADLSENEYNGEVDGDVTFDVEGADGSVLIMARWRAPDFRRGTNSCAAPSRAPMNKNENLATGRCQMVREAGSLAARRAVSATGCHVVSRIIFQWCGHVAHARDRPRAANTSTAHLTHSFFSLSLLLSLSLPIWLSLSISASAEHRLALERQLADREQQHQRKLDDAERSRRDEAERVPITAITFCCYCSCDDCAFVI